MAGMLEIQETEKGNDKDRRQKRGEGKRVAYVGKGCVKERSGERGIEGKERLGDRKGQREGKRGRWEKGGENQ